MALQEIYDLSHRFHTAVQEKDDLNKDKDHLGIMVGSQETRVRKSNYCLKGLNLICRSFNRN
jgi:hypothetical protein